jgi:hypothetical protein
MRRDLGTEPDDDGQAKCDRAWAQYRDRLSTDWQTGQTDPGRANAIERVGEQWRGGR